MRLAPLLLLLACAPAAAVPQGSPPPAPSSWADSVLATMTLRQKAAQMVWPQIFGDYVSADAASWQRATRAAEREGVGGFIVSVGSPLEIAAKLNALQKMSALPLLVGADLEFGAGYRARGGYFVPNGIDLGGAVIFPPHMALGATRDSALAYEQGRVTAIEGRALGIHITFAPVLDVNNNPANPVINVRSFGADPKLVARLGAAFVRGVEEHGMLATAKHFPGHGDTEVNSHLALPVVNVSRPRLDSVELVPFRAAVRAGVSAIMTFHGAMPALDPSGDPGTLSRPVLTSLLREQMKFEGLIFTDAMDMRGILVQYGPDTAAMRAVEAGADVLLMPLDVGRTIDAVVRGVTEGRYTEERLDRSVRRILASKERLRLHRSRTVDLDSARLMVGDSAHAALARSAAVRSITLVKDSLRLLPLGSRPSNSRVLSITFARRADLSAGQAFNAELRRVFRGVREEYVDADGGGPNYQRLLRVADSADVVIVSPYVGHSWDVATVAAPAAFAEFVRALVRGGRSPIVMAMGNPYFLQQVPEVSTYVVAWGGFPVSQQAAAWALLGTNAITGRLPIAIPPVAPLGAGETRAQLAAGASSSTRSRQ